ncbi:MAG: permease-like cell division protein FtsX [Clostridia bacterium]|nr:permease-like cell division protein FtsX [Clostridia bacterium]
MKNFSYFFKEGVMNLFTNKMVTLMTLLTVIVSLLVTGVFQVVSSNLMHISREVGNNFEFNIYIKDSVPAEQLNAVGEKIMGVAMVNDVVLKPKADTFTEFKDKVANDSLLKGLSEEENPFRDCFIVTLTNLDQADYVLGEIKLLEEVDSVSNNLETSKKLSAIEKKVKLYSIIIYVLLAILCLSIISNIINLSIFSRRKQINIMKYVGATNGFVKAPFIIEGVLVGMVGALLSSAILSYLYSLLYSNFSQVLEGVYLLPPIPVFLELLVMNAAYGILIGGLGAAVAVNKHVKV